MFGLQTLDVAIGLIFVFLLLSLVVTAVNELIASWLKRRSTTMWRGVVRLLGGEKWAAAVYGHPLIAGLNEKPWFEPYRKNLPFRKRPSYIPSRTFAMALIDTLAPASMTKARTAEELRAALAAKLAAEPDSHLLQSLAVLLEDSGGELEKFKVKIEEWFNGSMERVTGWYKRRTQWILILLAAAVTVWSNADTIVITNTLWRDPAMRSALAAQAQQFAEENRKQTEAAEAAPAPAGPPAPPDRLPYETAEAAGQTASEKFDESVSRLHSLALPLGWRDPAQDGDGREPQPCGWKEWRDAVRRHFLGWLLTALAVSLGAPFWFDMLNRVISIRAAGKSPDEKPKTQQAEGQKRNASLSST